MTSSRFKCIVVNVASSPASSYSIGLTNISIFIRYQYLNLVVSAGEECDCGDPSYCTSTCCDANTCKLIQSATCWHGPCCNTDTCQPLANDVICRKKSDAECDVDDTCDGISTTCRNKFEENGMTCDEGRGVCFDGSCR